MKHFGHWIIEPFGGSWLYRIAPFGLALVCVLGLLFSSALLAAGINSNQYAWAENAGWLNFNSLNTSASVQVYADHLEGYVWAENLGWIRLGSHSGGGAHTYTNDAAATYGVNHDGAGNLSGYAWSESAGWINFTAQSGGGVTLDLTTGQFSGYAWSENVGWISLAGTALNAATYFVAVQTYTVTPSAGSGGTVNPSTAQTVFADTTPTFTVTPNTDYVRNNTVTGDCPAGSWNGNLYTTGAITANCSVGFSFTYNPAPPTPINGACGSANGQTVTSAPTANLCTAGTASTVTTTSTAYAWNCTGSNGGSTAACSATRAEPMSPAVQLSANPGNPAINQAITFTVTVIAPSGTPGIPTGSVVVSGGGQTCTVTLSQGSGACVLSYPSAGDVTVTAAYSGDANFPAASNPLTLSVGKIATTLALTLTPTPSAPGQPVTLTATLNPMSTPMRSASATASDGLPTGTVTFRDDGTVLGTAPLTEGSATLTVTTLTPGVHSLTATYSGDDVFAASTSSVVSHIVATDIPTLSEGALLLLGLLLVSLVWSQRRRFG